MIWGAHPYFWKHTYRINNDDVFHSFQNVAEHNSRDADFKRYLTFAHRLSFSSFVPPVATSFSGIFKGDKSMVGLMLPTCCFGDSHFMDWKKSSPQKSRRWNSFSLDKLMLNWVGTTQTQRSLEEEIPPPLTYFKLHL